MTVANEINKESEAVAGSEATALPFKPHPDDRVPIIELRNVDVTFRTRAGTIFNPTY